MNLHPKKLITVVCEAVARDTLVALLRDCGANGYTVSAVEGWGAKGGRFADIPEDANIELKTVVSEEKAEQLLQRLSETILPRFATVIYVCDVRVLREGKF